jgi:hypothetical protein
MILEKQTEVVVVEEGIENDAIGMSLDLDSANMLMQMLSKNLYSDSVGSTIRETCSNALDSHRRAGVNLPIIASIERDDRTYNYSFCVEDFGIGLDDDDVRNIISKYGKSTKRNSATELGMFGLGFKAPLAYSSSFYFVCRKDGIERKYMMHENDEGNSINLLYETATSERNGVKVIIPMKSGDRYTFEKKISEQLAYFENVHVSILGEVKEFKIFRHELFQYSEMITDSYVHLCLDNVYYPLDYSKFSFLRIDVPIGIRLSLNDGVYPTPNREAIRYTDTAKKVIEEKLKKVADYFVTKYNNAITNAEIKDISIMHSHYCGIREISILDNNKRHDAKELMKLSKIPVQSPSMPKYPLLNMKQILYSDSTQVFRDYDIALSIHHRSSSKREGMFMFNEFINQFDTFKWFLKDTPRIPEYIKSHLKSINKSVTKVITPNSFKRTLKDYRTGYIPVLGLRNVPKTEWRNTIVQFEEFRKEILSTMFVPISGFEREDSVVTKPNSVRKQRIKLADGEFSARMGRKKSGYQGGMMFEKTAPVQLKGFHKRPFVLVYGREEQESILKNIYIYTKGKVGVALVGERAYNSLKNVNIHNLISVEKFMEGSHVSFRRIATATLVHKKMVQKYDNGLYMLRCCKFMKNIISSLGNDLETLRDYHHKYNDCVSQVDEDFRDSLIEIAQRNNLIDTSVIAAIARVEKFVEENSWFPKMSRQIYREDISEPIVELIVTSLKYKKYRLNTIHYAPVVEQGKQDIQSLEDELIG